MKVSVPGVGCKKGSIEFFFGIEDGNVMPLDFTMKLTNLDTDQMPAFMDHWCDEDSLKDAYSVHEIWDQVLRMQGAATMDKADKMIEKLDEKYKALRDRVANFIEDHYGNNDNGVVLDILNYYDFWTITNLHMEDCGNDY
jgi:predicted transcriptional regulator